MSKSRSRGKRVLGHRAVTPWTPKQWRKMRVKETPTRIPIIVEVPWYDFRPGFVLALAAALLALAFVSNNL